MKAIDRLLQSWRQQVGMRWLGSDVRVIDVGAHRGELFEALGQRLRCGFGVEPLGSCERESARYTIHHGPFPTVRPEVKEWDAITMFAVLEHIPRAEQPALAGACYDLLRPGGRVVVTVPSKSVDAILSILRALRLIDGMSLEEHFGFEASETLSTFSPPQFKVVHQSRFQFGLNHLFVFEKQPAPPRGRSGSG